MKTLSLYIHVPFCTRRCSYCSFYHVPAAREREHAFVDALVDEIAVALAEIGRVSLRTVFVGGGTPTVLEPHEWERVLAAIAPFVPAGGVEEFTVEMNPEDVDQGLVRFLHGLGVNRASVGIQSMHEVGQKVLKRCTPDVNASAIDVVQKTWDNVSFDVLLGVPKTDLADLRETLRILLEKSPRHLSVYGLEPGGDLGEEVERFFRAVDPDRVADEYLETCGLVAAAGFGHYEVSNFARPGFDYLGVGPAAHSSIGGRRFANAPSIDAYVSRRGPEHLAARLFDDGGDARLEEMMLALRTDRGIARTACDPRTADELVVEGLATVDAGRIRLTDHGYLVLNDVVLRLLAATPC
jgi:oxygen-independent coproporphyrinogen-3 oxidase